MNESPHAPANEAGAPVAAIAIDAADLTLSSGLLSLVRPALALLPGGGVLAIRSRASALRDDLPTWCRIERHAYLGCEAERDTGQDEIVRHLIARGTLGEAREPHGVHELPIVRSDGRVGASALLKAVPFPVRADVRSGDRKSVV